MKKKKLISDNEILLERLNTAENIISELKSKLARSETQIEILNNTIASLKAEKLMKNNENDETDKEFSESEASTYADSAADEFEENNDDELTQNLPDNNSSDNSDVSETIEEGTSVETDNDTEIHSIFSCEMPEFISVIDYSSKVIGKIVVESTKVNCVLAAKKNESKELISLILGKAEVVKAEILKIISSSENPEDKKKQIDKQYFDCLKYFSNIIG